MPKAKGHQFIRDKLLRILEPTLKGIEIEVGDELRLIPFRLAPVVMCRPEAISVSTRFGVSNVAPRYRL